MHLWLIPILPLAGALLNGLLGRRLSRGVVAFFGCGAAGTAFGVSLWVAWRFLDLPSDKVPLIVNHFTWIQSGGFDAAFGFYYDRLTLIMTLVVTGVGFLIHIYSVGYMAEEDGFYRFFAYLNLFLFAMLILIMANNYLLMFVGWEGVGLCSYLLIGFYFLKKSAADAGKKAFIVNRIGDFGFLLGIVLIFWTFGVVDFESLFYLVGNLPEEAKVGLTAICLLLLLGAVGKSAQVPLYVWLPDAMEGPTPVSALIHAATMVTAGVYMVARSHLLFEASPFAMQLVAVLGCVTAFYAGTIALAQNDLKRVLAYSTISQLGYMFLACGLGAFAAGIFHLMTHAFFKALLFLAAGSVMHALAGELDMRKMGGLRRHLPWTFGTFLVGTLAIAGAPFLSGFYSKEAILVAAREGPYGGTWIFALAVFTAGLTSLYMFRAVFLTFFGSSRLTPELSGHVHESPPSMRVPLVLLALLSVVGGWFSYEGSSGSGAFEAFLQPVFAPGSASQIAATAHVAEGETTVLIASLTAAGLGFLIATLFFLRFPAWAKGTAERFGLAYRLLANKYYVDEIYDTLFVRPLRWTSETILWRGIDVGAIDRLVNGTGQGAGMLGSWVRRIQSGNIGSYAAWIILGAVIWLGYIVSRG